MLDMDNTDQGNIRLLLSQLSDADLEKFLEDQFQITHVKYDYAAFSKQLTGLAKEKGLAIDLEHDFLEKQLRKLNDLADEATDAREKSTLSKIETEFTRIEKILQAHGS